MELRNYITSINRQLLPVKVHYFLFLAALACALPFRTIFAKQLGLSGTAVGTIFFAAPFMRILSNPLIGFILDYFKRFRLTISVIMLVVAFSHIAMVSIPVKESESVTKILTSDRNSGFYSRVQYSFLNENEHQLLFFNAYNGSDLEGTTKFNHTMECSVKSNDFPVPQTDRAKSCDKNLGFKFKATVSISNYEMAVQVTDGKLRIDEKMNTNLFINISSSLYKYQFLERFVLSQGIRVDQVMFYSSSPVVENALDGNNGSVGTAKKDILSFISSKKLDHEKQVLISLNKLVIKEDPMDWFNTRPCLLNLDCDAEESSAASSTNHKGNELLLDEVKVEPRENEYLSVQFWALLLLITISSQTFSAIMFMMDAVCYEMLQDRKEKYGEQRLWGTVGWGVGALAGGYLNQLFSAGSPEVNYAPSFYLLAIISLLDLFVIAQLKVTDVKYSSHIWKDVCLLLSKMDIVYNLLIIYFIGVLSGFMWNYQFWFMTDLGASQVLLGLSQTFECLFELPWFIASGWIIRKIGHANSNSVALLCFGLRFLCFELMYDPWMTLPAAILHGPTFGLFYVSLTMYAKSEAPAGTEATVQSLIHLSFEGVGAATGVILGGIGLDKLGSRDTFGIATRSSFLLLAVNLVATAAIYVSKRKTKSADITPVDKKDELQTCTEDRH